jgi:hypothetical protein
LDLRYVQKAEYIIKGATGGTIEWNTLWLQSKTGTEKRLEQLPLNQLLEFMAGLESIVRQQQADYCFTVFHEQPFLLRFPYFRTIILDFFDIKTATKQLVSLGFRKADRITQVIIRFCRGGSAIILAYKH